MYHLVKVTEILLIVGDVAVSSRPLDHNLQLQPDEPLDQRLKINHNIG